MDSVGFRTRREDAVKRLKRCKSVLVALSGGVDSAALLAPSIEALRPGAVVAATAESESLAGAELGDARKVAQRLGAEHVVVRTGELANPDYRANRGDRCFHCRTEMFAVFRRLADERGLHRVVYGAVPEDLGDDRPGMLAAERAGALAPLLDAGVSKTEVRQIARRR